MAKFSVEYSRTVRVKAYEIVKIGLVEEFDDEFTSYDEAFCNVQAHVQIWIEQELERLGGERHEKR